MYASALINLVFVSTRGRLYVGILRNLQAQIQCCGKAARSKIGPEVIKLFFMLNSAEHEILYALKYKKYREMRYFSGSYKPRMLFLLLINVKMPTVVGILTFMSGKKLMLR